MGGDGLTVVWHCACMMDWAPVVREQLDLMQRVGLTVIHGTHLGEGREVVQRWARERGVDLVWESSDPNLSHYETHAMLLIERLARVNEGCTLYWHTKGVSHPGSDVHRRWRQAMQRHLIEPWRAVLAQMGGHDIAGLSFGFCFGRPHYPGNFWMARNDYVRRLPDYAPYHGSLQLTRFTCETWHGEASRGARVLSLGARDLCWQDIVARFG